MLPTPSSPRFRFRSALAPLAVGLLLVTASACGSDDDGASGDTTAPAESVAVADPPVDTGATDTSADTTPTDAAATGSVPTDSGAGGGDTSATCGGLSAADVGAAVGAEFDSADDISIDTDETCLFSSSTATDGVTIVTQSADTYLGGMLAGLPVEEALTQLESAQSIVLEDGYTVERTTVGGSPAVVITGTNAMVTIPTGYASTVVDGVVIEVTLDGAALAPDAAGLGPLAGAVLDLAVGAQA
jgi:hypothetical protein